MDCWTLFFLGLSAIATTGLLICTIIGFKYIHKQTRIAQNKDIILIIQKSLENEMNEYINRDFTIMNAIELFIKDTFYDPNHNNIELTNYQSSVEYKNRKIPEDVKTKYDKLIKNNTTFIPKEFFALYYWALNDKENRELEQIRNDIYNSNILDKIKDLRSIKDVIVDNQMIKVEFENVLYQTFKARMEVLTASAEKIRKFLSDIAKERGLL